MNINIKFSVFTPFALLLALLTGCTGGSSDSPLAPTGATVTITGPIGNLTYLNHTPSFLQNTATTFYNNWAGLQSDIFMQYYLAGGLLTSDRVSISGTSDNGTKFWVGTSASAIICVVSNLPPLPLCSDWGITVDRTAGTLTFVNTPVFNEANNAETGTMNGTLTFPPF